MPSAPPKPAMSEPRTAAGRALLRDTADKRLWVGPFDTVLDAILAIEAEAATPPASAKRDAVVQVAADLYSIAVGEHGHDETHFAAWPSCLPAHIAFNRYRILRAAEARDRG